MTRPTDRNRVHAVVLLDDRTSLFPLPNAVCPMVLSRAGLAVRIWPTVDGTVDGVDPIDVVPHGVELGYVHPGLTSRTPHCAVWTNCSFPALYHCKPPCGFVINKYRVSTRLYKRGQDILVTRKGRTKHSILLYNYPNYTKYLRKRPDFLARSGPTMDRLAVCYRTLSREHRVSDTVALGNPDKRPTRPLSCTTSTRTTKMHQKSTQKGACEGPKG
jgi:hypothetical protein